MARVRDRRILLGSRPHSTSHKATAYMQTIFLQHCPLYDKITIHFHHRYAAREGIYADDVDFIDENRQPCI